MLNGSSQINQSINCLEVVSSTTKLSQLTQHIAPGTAHEFGLVQRRIGAFDQRDSSLRCISFCIANTNAQLQPQQATENVAGARIEKSTVALDYYVSDDVNSLGLNPHHPPGLCSVKEPVTVDLVATQSKELNNS